MSMSITKYIFFYMLKYRSIYFLVGYKSWIKKFVFTCTPGVPGRVIICGANLNWGCKPINLGAKVLGVLAAAVWVFEVALIVFEEATAGRLGFGLTFNTTPGNAWLAGLDTTWVKIWGWPDPDWETIGLVRVKTVVAVDITWLWLIADNCVTFDSFERVLLLTVPLVGPVAWTTTVVGLTSFVVVKRRVWGLELVETFKDWEAGLEIDCTLEFGEGVSDWFIELETWLT